MADNRSGGDQAEAQRANFEQPESSINHREKLKVKANKARNKKRVGETTRPGKQRGWECQRGGESQWGSERRAQL